METWVEIRTERGDLLMEHHQRDRVPVPGETMNVAGECVQVLDAPARTEQREDELEGTIPVWVVPGRLVNSGPLSRRQKWI